MTYLGKKTLTEVVSGIASGTTKAEALVQECLARIDARDSEIAAWTYVAREQALAEARARDKETPRSPLHGLPVAVKDVIDTCDMPTEYGSPIYKGFRPHLDAACVAMVRAAGGIVLGKTVTTEFATRKPGPTRNPHNLEHTPGGSSSGSGAAVADGMVPLSFGTQTAGSVIRPASYCGVVGYKPTFNTISRVGLKLISDSLDTIGVLTATVADAALLVGTLHRKPLGAFDARPSAPRIGFCRTPVWDKAEDTTRALLEDAVARLAKAGAKVSDVELAPECADLFRTQANLSGVEGMRSLAHEWRTNRDLISDMLQTKLQAAVDDFSVDDYFTAQRFAEGCRLKTDALFNDFDVLVTPSAMGEAPKGIEATGDPMFNTLWTVLYTPAVTVPALSGPNGLPVGVQVVGPRFGDDQTLTYAEWVHQALT